MNPSIFAFTKEAVQLLNRFTGTDRDLVQAVARSIADTRAAFTGAGIEQVYTSDILSAARALPAGINVPEIALPEGYFEMSKRDQATVGIL